MSPTKATRLIIIAGLSIGVFLEAGFWTVLSLTLLYMVKD